MSKQKNAKLRVCSCCEWIFYIDEASIHGGCPVCNFAHYGARFVYGNKAYRFAKTQQPWYEQKIADYSCKVGSELRNLQLKHTKVRTKSFSSLKDLLKRSHNGYTSCILD